MAVETESFTASDGTAITNVGSSIWTYAAGTSDHLFVTSNQVRHKINTNSTTIASRAGTFTDNQYAQITLKKVSVSQSYIGVAVRSSSGNAYWLYVSGTAYVLGKTISFGYNEIRVAGRTFNINDVLRLEVEGTTLRAIQNGATFWTATDSALSTGKVGVSGAGTNVTDFNAADDWEGGDLVTAALQNFQYDWPHQLHARR
jgi:hypothetical protein